MKTSAEPIPVVVVRSTDLQDIQEEREERRERREERQENREYNQDGVKGFALAVTSLMLVIVAAMSVVYVRRMLKVGEVE